MKIEVLQCALPLAYLLSLRLKYAQRRPVWEAYLLAASASERSDSSTLGHGALLDAADVFVLIVNC